MAGSYVSGGGSGSNGRVPIHILLLDESKPILSSESVNDKSDLFVVRNGQGILLSAWGLDPTDEITIIKVLLDHPPPPQGEGCSSKLVLDDQSTIVAEEVVRCGAWNLSLCKNVGYLTTPGVYRFEHIQEAVEGEVIVNDFTLQGTGVASVDIPDNLILENGAL